MQYNKILPVFILTLLLGGCLTNSEFNNEFAEATLIGKIYDRANLPCGNVVIQVDSKVATTTDINGRFYINDLSRGVHTITFIKKGYREDTIEFEFSNALQSLYHQMISIDQILTEIEKALDKDDYDTAFIFLTEGKKVEPNNLVLDYLLGIYYYRLERFDLAIQQLESMLARGQKERFIYMTLTDIYEYNLGDYAKANENILKYLELADDREAALRQHVIESRIPTEETTSPAEGATADGAAAEAAVKIED